jgi:hypothetical protein
VSPPWEGKDFAGGYDRDLPQTTAAFAPTASTRRVSAASAAFGSVGLGFRQAQDDKPGGNDGGRSGWIATGVQRVASRLTRLPCRTRGCRIRQRRLVRLGSQPYKARCAKLRMRWRLPQEKSCGVSSPRETWRGLRYRELILLLDAVGRRWYNGDSCLKRARLTEPWLHRTRHTEGGAVGCRGNTACGVSSDSASRALPKEALARVFPKKGCFYQTNPTEKCGSISP